MTDVPERRVIPVEDLTDEEMQLIMESAPQRYARAVVKFNGGNGALLCNRCGRIIAYGFEHEDVEHVCDDCRTGKPPPAKTDLWVGN